jgi:O-antigen/teichoic acid export membrane protein
MLTSFKPGAQRKTGASPKRLARVTREVAQALSQSKKGITDVVVSMVPQGVSLASGFFTSILVARGLGPVGLGQYALVLSVSDVATTLSDLGIGQTAIRYASRAARLGDSETQFAVLRWTFQRRMSLLVLIGLVAFLAAPFVAGRIWHVPQLTSLIRLGLLIGVFGAFAHVPSLYFQSLRRFHVNSAVLTAQALISLSGILVLASLRRWSVGSVVVVSIVTAGVGAFVFLLLVPKTVLVSGRRRQPPPAAPPRARWGNPITANSEPQDAAVLESPDVFAFYMLLSSVLVILIMKADVWLLGYFLDMRSVGLYNAGARLSLPLATLLAAINTALWPRASSLVRIEDKIALLRKTIRLCSLVALAGLGYAIVAPLLAPFLFGARYARSVFLGQLLCIRYLLALLACPVGVVGYTLGFVRIYWLVNLLQLLIVLGLNVVLLPMIGPVGSALALIANDAVGLVCIGMLIRWKLAQQKEP